MLSELSARRISISLVIIVVVSPTLSSYISAAAAPHLDSNPHHVHGSDSEDVQTTPTPLLRTPTLLYCVTYSTDHTAIRPPNSVPGVAAKCIVSNVPSCRNLGRQIHKLIVAAAE